MKAVAVLALCAFATLASPALAESAAFADLALEPRPGARLPLTMQLIDEAGDPVSLGHFFDRKPVILVLDSLQCRTVCGVLLGQRGDAAAGRVHTSLATRSGGG